MNQYGVSKLQKKNTNEGTNLKIWIKNLFSTKKNKKRERGSNIKHQPINKKKTGFHTLGELVVVRKHYNEEEKETTQLSVIGRGTKQFAFKKEDAGRR